MRRNPGLLYCTCQDGASSFRFNGCAPSRDGDLKDRLSELQSVADYHPSNQKLRSPFLQGRCELQLARQPVGLAAAEPVSNAAHIALEGHENAAGLALSGGLEKESPVE